MAARAGRPRGAATQVRWPELLDRAAEIVRSYDTRVTLRQLFYRLVAAELVPNTQSSYSTLSRRTAEARRAGGFPRLVDQGRQIHRRPSWDSSRAARQWLAEVYGRDRTEGQAVGLYLGVEKRGLLALLSSWFDNLGLPIVPLGGYSSESLEADLLDDIEGDARRRKRSRMVLLVASDFDASGVDLVRNLERRVGHAFDEVVRVALTYEQVVEFALPILPGKDTDSRQRAFVDAYGAAMQVEVDALPPEVLHDLFQTAILRYWTSKPHAAVLARERRDRAALVKEGT